MTPKETKPQPAKTTAIAKADQCVHQAEAEYYKGRAAREQEMLGIQAELVKCRKIELDANMEIAADQAEREEQALWIAEQNLELRKEELTLAKKRLQQDKAIADAQRQLLEKSLKLHERELELSIEEFQERRKLSQQVLEWLKEHEANAFEMQRQENLAAWDRENWQGILSRDEVQNILIAGQRRHRLLMLVSPPDISSDCPETFRNNLQMKVSSELKGFLEQHYPLNSDACPVEFYGKFFKSAIFDAEVKKLEAVLSPVPTVILYSNMTNEELFLHVGLWGLGDHAAPISLPAWKWEEALNALAEEGTSEKEQLRQIQRAIVAIHKVIAAALADCYYLAVTPLYAPRMLNMTPEEMREEGFDAPGMEGYFNALRERVRQIAAAYQRELAERAGQFEQEEQERRQRETEEAAKRQQAEAARLAREAADRELGRCKALRDLLDAGKWKEANEETWRLIVGGLKEEQICDLSVAKAIEDLPASEARTMNRLWEQYSHGRFGFRVQQRIYEECQQNFVNFACHVGWRFYYDCEYEKDNYHLRRHRNDTKTCMPLIRYGLNALEGHLPVFPLSNLREENDEDKIQYFNTPCFNKDLWYVYKIKDNNGKLGSGQLFQGVSISSYNQLVFYDEDQIDYKNAKLVNAPETVYRAINLYLEADSNATQKFGCSHFFGSYRTKQDYKKLEQRREYFEADTTFIASKKLCSERSINIRRLANLQIHSSERVMIILCDQNFSEKQCLAALWTKCGDAPAVAPA